MDSRSFQEPTNPRSKKPAGRRQGSTRRAFKGRTLSAGQLYLLRELLQEFAQALDINVKDADSTPEYVLQSRMPNLVEYIEYRLERLRIDQEMLDKAWEPEGR